MGWVGAKLWDFDSSANLGELACFLYGVGEFDCGAVLFQNDLRNKVSGAGWEVREVRWIVFTGIY